MNDRSQEPKARLPAEVDGETALLGEMIQPAYSALGDRAFISDAAEQLFQIFRTGFEREWVLEQLESVPGVAVAEAETELHVLDLFAVDFAIRRHPAQIWQQHGAALYEQFLALVLNWWSTAANSSIVPLLENRFAVYNQILSGTAYATLDDMVSSVAIMAAMFLPANCVEYSGPEHRDADALALFVSALKALMEDGNPLAVTAARYSDAATTRLRNCSPRSSNVTD